MTLALRASIAATAVLMLAACGQPGAQAPQATLTTDDVLYLNELQHGSIDVHRTRRWLSYGKHTCTVLSHNSVPTVAAELTQHMRSAEASVVIVAAVHHYCPWLASKHRMSQ